MMEPKQEEPFEDASVANSDKKTLDSRILSESKNSKPRGFLKKPSKNSSNNLKKKLSKCNCHGSKSKHRLLHQNPSSNTQQLQKNLSKMGPLTERKSSLEEKMIDSFLCCLKTLNRRKVIQELKQVFDIDKSIHLKISPQIRYLSRKFELPSFLLQPIQDDLKNPTIGQNVKINLAQALKYGVRNDLNNNLDLGYEKLIELLEENSTEIKSAILWALGYKIKNSAKELSKELKENINSKITEDMAPEAKAFLKGQMAQHDYSINEQVKQEKNRAPLRIFSKSLRKRPQTYVTKNQHVTKSKFKNQESQESSLNIAYILERLRNQRGRIRLNSRFERNERLEEVKEGKGSHRSWTNGTYSDAKALYERAKYGLQITTQDKEWLTKKFLNDSKFFTGGSLGDLLTDRMIAATFNIISEKQKLTACAIQKLVACLKDPWALSEFYSPDEDTETLLSNMLSSKVPSAPLEIEKKISNGIREIKDSKEKDITYHVLRKVEALFLNEIACLRRDAISALYNCVLRDREVLTPSYLVEVKTCLQDDDKRIRALAARIGSLIGNQEINDVKAFFNTCIFQLERGVDLEYSVDYIDQQSKDPKRCGELFTENMILRLSQILKRTDYEYQIKNDCNHIINNYLEHSFTKGLSLEALKNICFILEDKNLDDEERNKLKEKALVSVLLTAEKEKSLPLPIITLLVERMKSLDDNSVNFIIIILGKICDQADVEIPFPEEISLKLLDNRVIVDNGVRTTFGPRKESNSSLPAISEFTGRIILSFFKKGKKASSDVVNNLIEALASSDKQTRIQAAKAISFASNNHMADFGRDILVALEGYLTDKIPDVAIYSINAYTSIIRGIHEDDVSSNHLDVLATIYAYEELRLNENDEFSTAINKNILAVLTTQANKQIFSENVFSLFDYIFLSDDPNKKKALDIMRNYINKKHQIPDGTVHAIENMLGNPEASNKALYVLEKVIENGQRVSDKTLKIFADNLFSDKSGEEIKNKSFKMLEIADMNQDLSDHIFEVLELERAGYAIQPGAVDFEEALKFLEEQTQIGRKLSSSVLKALNKQINSPQTLSILINVSANGQLLPQYMIEKMKKIFNPKKKHEQFLTIFFNLAKNNQEVPLDLLEKLELMLDNKDLADQTLLIFTYQAKKGKDLNESVVKRIYNTFFSTTDRPLKQECLSAFFSIIKAHKGISQELAENAEEVLTNGINDENERIVETSLEGFDFLCTKKEALLRQESIEALVRRAVDPACPHDMKERIASLLKSQKLNEKQASQLKQATLNPDEDYDFLISLFKFPEKGGILLEQHFPRLNKVINEQIELQKAAIKILNRSANKHQFPEYLVDSVATLMFSTSLTDLRDLCLDLIREVAELGLKISEKAVSRVAILQNTDQVLLLIKKNQEIPRVSDLLLQIKTISDPAKENRLPDLLQKIVVELDHGLTLTEAAIQELVSLAKNHADLQEFASIFSQVLLQGSRIDADVIVVQIIEKVIGTRKIDLNIVKAYGKLIRCQKCQNLVESIDILAEFLQNNQSHEEEAKICFEIFSCFANAAKLKPLYEKALKLMETKLILKDAKIRGKCFQGLRAAKNFGFQSHLFEAYCVELLEKLKAHTTIQVNSEMDLLETLASLENWDLGKLEQTQGDWIRELLLSDMLTRLKANYSQKVHLSGRWVKTEQILKSQNLDPNKLLKALASCNSLNFENILDIIEFIPEIDSKKAEDILLESLDPFQELKQQWLFSLLSVCFRDQENSPEYKNQLALNITSRLTTQLISKLFGALSEVENLSELESLIDFAAGNNIEKGDILIKKASIKQLRRSLEIKLLIKCIQSQIHHVKFAMILKSLLEKNWPFEELMKMFKKAEFSSALEPRRLREQHLLQVLEILVYYKIPATKSAKILEILGCQVGEWIRKANKVAIEINFQANPQVKNHVDLVDELKKDNADNAHLQAFLRENPNLSEDIDQIQKTKLLSYIALLGRSALKITKAKIMNWAKKVKSNSEYWSKLESLKEALTIINEANALHTGFLLTNAQILSCIVLLNVDPEKGRLLQVGTGEGKSTIVSVVAIVHALQGKKVDIITSNPVLADRDSGEKAGLYKMFGLSCMDNADKSIYIKGPKDCYKKDIVYGEISQFQFDILRDEYSLLDTRTGRKCEVAILDEVDSMLIDDSSNIARLSSSIAGMDLLQPFIHLIWKRLNFLQQAITMEDGKSYKVSDQASKIPNIEKFAENVKNLNKQGDIETFFKDQLRSYLEEEIIDKRVIAVPENLSEFVKVQIPKWIDNAIRALMMQEDQQYVIQEGVVKPVAFDSTGVIQHATSWSDGLHQFIERKHGLRMTSETCTTNFLSNIGFIKKYGGSLYGLTGTLGSDKAKETLSQVFRVDLASIPNLHKKQYLELPPIICRNQRQWLEEICDSAVNETKKGRGTLVICQTIEDCKLIGSKLAQKYRSGAIKLYTMNNMDQEREIEKINPGEIIVATNLAGRGTDIKADNIEKNGGLHVILTFLPPNQRVEDQAFGRTARLGKRGTGQMILNIAALLQYGNACPQKIKEMRDEFESFMFNEFLEKELPMVDTKDELFSKFCQLKHEVHEGIKADTSLWQKLKNLGSGVYETSVLNALEERWAFFLHKIDNERIPSNQSHEKYSDFQKQILQDFGQNELIKNPYYHTTIANDLLTHLFFSDEKYNQAMFHYDQAIKLDSKCTAALVGQAWLAIQSFKKSGQSKSQIRQKLNESLEFLRQEMVVLNTMQAFVQRDFPNIECDLVKQLIEKTSILGSYMNSVENVSTVLKRSQRLVDITGTREGLNNAQDVVQVLKKFYDKERRDATREFLQEIKIYEKFKLVFNDLTVFSDTGDQDQAIITLSNVFKPSSILDPAEYKDLTITLNQLTYEGLRTIFDPDIEILGATKNLALDEVRKKFQKSCKVDLECLLDDQAEKSLDLEAKEAIEIIKKKQGEGVRFNILLKNVNETPKLLKEEASNGAIVTLEYTNLDYETVKSKLSHLKFDHLHLEISGIKAEISNALLKTTGCVQFYGREDEIESTEVEIARKRINKMEKRKVWIRIEKLNKEAAEEIIRFCPTASFQITLIHVEHLNNIEELEIELATISFSKLSLIFAQKLIPILRKASMDFTLGFENLNAQQLENVIKKASFDQEDIEITKVKKLSELYMKNNRPNLELSEFAERGIEYMLEINEKRFIPWRSIMTLAAVGSLQIVCGGLLVASGIGVSSGMGLMTEGAFDYINAFRAYRKRHFRWSDYVKQKALSLMISAVSIGVGKLTDGCKAADTALRGVKKEAIEKAGAQTVGGTVVKASGELNKLAFRQIFATTAGAFAREGLNNLVDYLFNSALERFKPEISSLIQKKIESQFCNESLKTLIGKMYALDKIKNSKYFANQIKNIFTKIVCPDNRNNNDIWDSIGGPLCRGILSNGKVIGSSFSMRIRIVATLSGLTQIAFMTDSIYGQFVKKLSDIDKELLPIHKILHRNYKIPLDEAIAISEILKTNEVIQSYKYNVPNQTAAKISKMAIERSVARNDHYYSSLISDVAGVLGAMKAQQTSPKEMKCEIINSQMFSADQKQNSEQKDTTLAIKYSQGKPLKDVQEIDFGNYERYKEDVVKFCSDLNKFSQTLDRNDLSTIMKEISDLITDQIIKVTESHLISPWSTYAVGMFTNNISAKVQDSLIRDQLKNDSESISKELKKLEEKDDKAPEEWKKIDEYRAELVEKAELSGREQITYEDLINDEVQKERTAEKNFSKMPSNDHQSTSPEMKHETLVERETSWQCLKEIAENANTLILIGTKAGEFFLKATGGCGRKVLIPLITVTNMGRITAVSYKMISELARSASDEGVLPLEILKKVYQEVAINGFDLVEASSKIKLKCMESVIPILEELKEPARKLKELEEFLRGDEEEGEEEDSLEVKSRNLPEESPNPVLTHDMMAFYKSGTETLLGDKKEIAVDGKDFDNLILCDGNHKNGDENLDETRKISQRKKVTLVDAHGQKKDGKDCS